jgi:hypothetical protein
MEDQLTTNIDENLVCFHHGLSYYGNLRSHLPPDIPVTYWFSSTLKMADYDEVIGKVRSTVERCAPWAEVIIGPKLFRIAEEGSDITRFEERYSLESGIAHTMGGVVIGRRAILLSTWGAKNVVHHELWHFLEHYVDPDDLDFFNTSLGDPEGNEAYWDSLIERRARYYEAWVLRYEAGILPKSICGIPVKRLDRIMLAAYSGRLSREYTDGRPSPARLLPGERLVRTVIGDIGWPGVALATAAIAFVLQRGGF